MSRKKEIIIGVVVVIFFIICLVFYNAYKNDRSPIKTIVTINKDTGQTIISDPNQVPQTYGTGNSIVILGANKLMPAGMTVDQFYLAEDFITNYVNSQLKRQYTQVSILNNGFKSTSTGLSAKLRLGSSQTLLNLIILYPDISSAEVKISSDSNNPYYAYDSGLQPIQ